MDKNYFIAKSFYEKGKKYTEEMSPYSNTIIFTKSCDVSIVNDYLYILENPIEHEIKSIMDAYYMIEVTLETGDKIKFETSEAISQIQNWLEIKKDVYSINITTYKPNGYTNNVLGAEVYDDDWNCITNVTNITLTEMKINGVNNYHVKSVEYDAINNIPNDITRLGNRKTIAPKQNVYRSLVNGYSKDCDIDGSLYNESPYGTSTKSNTLNGGAIKVTAKESDGIEKASGFKLSLPVNNGYYFMPNLTDYGYSASRSLVATLVTVTDGVITVEDTEKYGDELCLYISTYGNKANTEYYILFRCKDDEDYAYIYPSYCGLVLGANFKDLRKIMFMNNNVEYTPTEDYNPATKKYVDEHDITYTTFEIINGHTYTETSSGSGEYYSTDVAIPFTYFENWTQSEEDYFYGDDMYLSRAKFTYTDGTIKEVPLMSYNRHYISKGIPGFMTDYNEYTTDDEIKNFYLELFGKGSGAPIDNCISINIDPSKFTSIEITIPNMKVDKKYVDDVLTSVSPEIDETELNTMLNEIYGFSDVN